MLVGACLGVRAATLDDLGQTRLAQAEADRSLAATEADLADRRRVLGLAATSVAATRQQLDEASAKLNDTATTLEGRTAERDQLQTALTAVSNDLAGTDQALTAANQQVALNAGQITALQDCLDGVAGALAQVTSWDPGAATTTLASVEQSCSSARATVLESLKGVGGRP